jgi:ephrin-B
VFHTLQVRCFARHDDGNASSTLTKEQQTTFTGLRQRTEYGFQVRAKTTHGWGEFSPTVFKTTGQILGTGELQNRLVPNRIFLAPSVYENTIFTLSIVLKHDVWSI